jgi:hypothetical protein
MEQDETVTRIAAKIKTTTDFFMTIGVIFSIQNRNVPKENFLLRAPIITSVFQNTLKISGEGETDFGNSWFYSERGRSC